MKIKLTADRVSFGNSCVSVYDDEIFVQQSICVPRPLARVWFYRDGKIRSDSGAALARLSSRYSSVRMKQV